MRTSILLFTASMLLSASSALAQGGTTGPLTWIIEDGTLTINGEGEMPDYSPSYSAPWSMYYASIHTVVIETGVTTIGNRAFEGHSSLTSITLSGSVITIGERAFYACVSLTSATIPNSITKIRKESFTGCINLISIIIPDNVTVIEDFAFSHCYSLTSIIIPDSVVTIGQGAFYTCTNLISITLSSSITSIRNGTFSECINLTSITIPNSVTSIENSAFYACASLISIIIPNSVTTIEGFAFCSCTSLTSIILSNSVKTIGAYAFSYCENLLSITFPSSVISIGPQAFMDCTKLSSIIFSNGIKTIERNAFYSCTSLISIVIPCSVTTIGNGVFAICSSLTSIDVENESDNYASENGVLFDKNKTTLICYPSGKIASVYVLPNSVTNIENYAFSDCANLTSFEVENGNNSFTSEDGVLLDKNKTALICYPRGKTGTYVIPNSVITIEFGAFSFCTKLTSITIPNSVITIGESVFYGCSVLTSIIIPNGVTAIEYGTFFHCTNLTSITIPSSVTKIKDAAFFYCPSLTSITNLNPVPTATSIYAFDGLNQSACTLKVPTIAVSAYKNADRWKKFNIVGGGISVNPIANNNKYGYTMGEGLYEENEEVDVMAVARNGYKFVNWTKGGVEVSDRALYSFTVTENVELVAHFESEVGIGELQVTSYELQVYPNPTRGEVKILMSDYPICDVRLFDIAGCQISIVGKSEIGQSEIRKSEIAINMAHLPAGIYFLRIQTENGVVVRKVVKQ